jgi:hypothetical protein
MLNLGTATFRVAAKPVDGDIRQSRRNSNELSPFGGTRILILILNIRGLT